METQRIAAATQTADSASGDSTDEIGRLLALGKCKQAVELAKEQHKRLNTPHSHERLLQAYLARIEQFQSKGMVQEADALIALVRERFPAQRDRLAVLGIRGAAAGGRINELLAPLASAQLSPETRAQIESAIRQRIVDVAALASCEALPAEHPLRVAAAAIVRALDAVTSGPVSEPQIALPEISHRSPLAAWKLLVRAIASFHREDDAGCKMALDAMAPDSAARRLAPVLCAMLGGNPIRQGMAGVLYQRVMENLGLLREALKAIDTALGFSDFAWLKLSIRQTMRVSADLGREFQERLRQHISIACLLNGLDVTEVTPILGTTRKDAYFWRLLARAEESISHNIPAALFWERFLRHAIHEGMFEEGSLEAAAVWLQIGRLLSDVSAEQLKEAQEGVRDAGILKAYYQDQPPEIAALEPKPLERMLQELFAPGAGYAHAVAIDPAPATFRQWWESSKRSDANDNFLEQIAQRWHLINPHDCEPLLHLSQLAEKRKALKLALDRLDEAEKLDPLNPQVRQARVRLTLATLWRHFKQKKPDLVAKDLALLDALPAMQEPDRVAFMAGVRAAWHVLRGEQAQAQQAIDTLIARMGPLAGGAIFESIAHEARLPQGGARPVSPDVKKGNPRDVIAAEARTVRIGLELELPIMRPFAWEALIAEALRQRPVGLPEVDLLLIGRAAILRQMYEQAYLVSTAGLSSSHSALATARFLLLRAQSLWCAWMQPRSVQCLRAALELARQTHDEQLLREVLELLDRHEHVGRTVFAGPPRRSLDAELLAEVLKSERSATDFPRQPSEAERFLVAIDADDFDDDEEEDDDVDDMDDDAADGDLFDPGDLATLPSLPPAAVAKMEEFFRKRNVNPDDVMSNPKLLRQLLGELIKEHLGNSPIGDFGQLPWDGPGGSFGGSSRGRKKRRKKRK
jgi:hypothetical protein